MECTSSLSPPLPLPMWERVCGPARGHCPGVAQRGLVGRGSRTRCLCRSTAAWASELRGSQEEPDSGCSEGSSEAEKAQAASCVTPTREEQMQGSELQAVTLPHFARR